MSESFTQEFTEATAGQARRAAVTVAAWEKNSESDAFGSPAYYPNVEDIGNQPPAHARFRPSTSQQPGPDRFRISATESAVRDAVRRAVTRAADQVERMIEAANGGDALELSNAGFDLVNVLEELWTLRADREPNWRDLLNLLQGALAQEHFEVFTREKCIAIKEVVAEHLKAWTVDNDDIRSSISILRRAGLDPWKGISAASEIR